MNAAQVLPTPPASPEPVEYAYEDAAVYDASCDAPLSPSGSDSDGESTCSSDDGSMTSSASTIDDLDEDDFVQDEDMTTRAPPEPQMYELEEPVVLAPEFVPQFPGAVVEPCQPCQPCHPASVPVPVQASCIPRFPQLPYIWDMFNKYTSPAQLHQAVPFHHASYCANLQGCY